jgi:hypothetical protein
MTVAVMLSPGTATAGDEALLAAGGTARMPIVISPQASKDTQAVASELADYLKRITGATFTVTAGDGANGIVLGTMHQFPNPAFAKALELRRGVDGKEAYAISTSKTRVLLLGGDELGASHAAYRFLESLGCRWFFPAKEWEVVPSRSRLAVAMEEADRPVILSRRIWYMNFYESETGNRAIRDAQAWARRNRMAGSRGINCGHAWQSIIGDNRAAFAAHPEYRALTGGKRQGEQICVSNPGVRMLATDWALGQLRRNPSQDMVSMECSDGDGQCECEQCKKLGSIPNRVFGLANAVANAVGKEFPGKMVGLYAYNQHCEPPSFPLEPNVYVQSTAGFITGKYTFDELVELWPKVCKNMGFYLYLSVYLWDFDMLPGGNGANVPWLRRMIPRLAAAGATSIDCESGNNWGLHGRGYYVANRLMWNPQVDVDTLLADFYDKALGPAAPVMRRYYERLDPGNKPLMSENLIAQALHDLDEASRLAAGRPDIEARLDHLKQYLHYVRLRWDAGHTTDKARQKETTLAAITHAYRTRHSYMNAWEALRQMWTPEAAKAFDEPAWSFNEPTVPKAWQKDAPCTRAETEACFRDDLRRFELQDVMEVRFSTDLVPAGLRSGAPAASSQSYQNPGKYALYSLQGEPLEFSLSAGLIAWYRHRAEAEYRVEDSSGAEMAKARLPLDGKPHPLSLAVPKAGLYWLVVNDQGTAWNVSAAAGKPIVAVLSRDFHPIHLGWMQRMYFYVPKRTKEFQYFWNGGPHRLYGPDGKERRHVTASGKYITVNVPPGDDGKAWSFGELALGELCFCNIPNYLAASPDALLLPREVTKKD